MSAVPDPVEVQPLTREQRAERAEERHQASVAEPVRIWADAEPVDVQLPTDEIVEDGEPLTVDAVLDTLAADYDQWHDMGSVAQEWELLPEVSDIGVQVYDPEKRRWSAPKTLSKRIEERSGDGGDGSDGG